MHKRVWVLWIALCMGFSLILPVSAADAEGTCGEGISWSLSGGTLTVSGSGVMADCPDGAPWDAYKDQITKLVFTGGITYIGAYTFDDYDKITSIDFGSALYEIGTDAFRNCDGLTSLSFPASFKVFGENCLRRCQNLTALHCAGRFPSFRLNCMLDTYATIYYPASNPWKENNIRDLESAFHGRIVFLNSDGIDPYAPVEETTAETTQETTVETTAETTVPTEATTLPTEETTLPSQTQTTPSEQQSTQEQTVPTETQPRQEAPKKTVNTLAIVSGIVAVVMLIAIGLLIAYIRAERRRRARRRRRRS